MTKDSLTNATQIVSISLQKQVMQIGFPLGLIYISIYLIAYLFSLDTNPIIGYLSWLIMLGASYYCIYTYRKEQSGIISFKEAFTLSFFVIILASLISTAYFFIHIQYINTHYISDLMDLQKQEMLKKGMSEEMVAKALQVSKGFYKPEFFIPIGLGTNIIVAAIISSIFAYFMKKNPTSKN